MRVLIGRARGALLVIGCAVASCNSNPGPTPDASATNTADDAGEGEGALGPSADGSGLSGDGGQGASSCAPGGGSLASVWPLGSLTPSAMTADAQGNVFISGTFEGTVAVGSKTLVSAGQDDMFLLKIDPTGQVLAATRFGTTSYDDPAPSVAVDASDNVFFSGFFSNTIDFGGTTQPLTAISVDAFVVKFDATGTAVWADRFGYDMGPYDAASVVIGPGGDPVIAGTAGGTIILGGKTWSAPNPAKNQPFAARLSTSDGSVVWSAASGGDFDTDKLHVTVDSAGRTFIVGECLSGSGAWGSTEDDDGGAFGAFRVGFDVSGTPIWSQLDEGATPVSVAMDHAGRVSVVEDLYDQAVVGTSTFTGIGFSMLALLVNPGDGTLLSGTAVSETFPWAATADARGFTFATGQFWQTATFGATTLHSPGYTGADDSFYIAQIDPTSHFVWSQNIGAGNTQPLAMAVTPAGLVAVVATTDTAFTTAAGSVPIGAFLAMFAPAACAVDPGPAIPPSSGSSGDLLDAAPPGVDAARATCPATQAEATSGAACPVATGCSYGTTCCLCAPVACNGQPTTWTCDPLGTPDPGCPTTPPSPAGSCPGGVQCNYCLPGGRYFADCTAGGWSVGYAQLLCN